MIDYLLRRLVMLIPVLFGVSILVFALMEWIPGDPALAILGPMATEENLEALRQDLNLDAPVHQRYTTWIHGMIRGDWGYSYSLERPVWDEVFERFGATLILAAAALGLSIILGLSAGMYMAIRQNSWCEKWVMVLVTTGISIPAFWLGMLFIMLFAIQLRWLPAGGMVPAHLDFSLLQMLPHLLLPSITLAIVAASVVARIMRARMLEILRMDFIRTARAKGLSESHILWRHAVPNALPAMLPLLGLQAGYVLGGAVYVETIFQWPGIGSMLVYAIQTRDLLLVQGGVLMIAVSYVLINLLADWAQHILDPRTQ